jgi:hypothetical protein
MMTLESFETVADAPFVCDLGSQIPAFRSHYVDSKRSGTAQQLVNGY